MSRRPGYGACFYVVCYLPVTSDEYALPVPFSQLPTLLPDFAPAQIDHRRVRCPFLVAVILFFVVVAVVAVVVVVFVFFGVSVAVVVRRRCGCARARVCVTGCWRRSVVVREHSLCIFD